MEPTNQEPEGDYGYDEVHADVRRPQRTEPAPQPEQRRPAQRGPESGEDYGYDEAHSF